MSDISDRIRKLRKELSDLASRNPLQEECVLELSRQIDTLVVSYLREEGDSERELEGAESQAGGGNPRDMSQDRT
ncbi:MAG: aspartyl-phosphate phosphatase Spo0E family protein [Firmicutes bacterium]|nr:aspartyl-phosphate phosphatase Spo0E family protein [Bacillota bacterium]